ncbi:DUF4253 domain-containing protein [Dactylosporangium siamense]|uniref:DUF4253 domain-containing protein n=1 Tax=Dactylosporangium siamense TaxID=685454 RepID=A0A919U7U9_9ACTN|nr:DUF4253 domain-containing protein [Dactylosporangium siamense]GIG45012.1 hypothetical protein Dsi01nite_030530 [Dactylosporangium siamense]
MSGSSELPRLLAALPDALAAAGVALSEGRLVHGDEGDDDQPAMWVSDGPATRQLWTAARAVHEKSGLWPLLLDHLRGDTARPWDDGELRPDDLSDPGDWDAQTLMAGWWADHTGIDDSDNLSPADRLAVTAPYGQRWPGLAAPQPAGDDPDLHADECVSVMLANNPRLRLGLVATTRGADSITAAGWEGPANYTDTAKLSAVLRSWERRFATRVIGVGFAELYLSVAAPPTDHATALHIAAEHFAFCPDNVWQGGAPDLTSYASQLIDARIWSFWWD